MSDRRLRIAVVSDRGSIGGAGVSATRLSRALRLAGHHVAMVFRADGWVDPECTHETIPIQPSGRWASRAWTLHRSPITRRLAQASWVREIGRTLDAFRPDAISVHNLHSAEWDVDVVRAALEYAPVAWTLHDLWPLTGGCALPFDCLQFMSRCTRTCPQAGQPPAFPRRMIKSAHLRRRRLFDSLRRLVLVAPSSWVESMAMQNQEAAGLVRRVSHGLDLDRFRPRDAAAARDQLGLPNDDVPTLLTSGHSLKVKRKGLWDLAAALREIPQPIRLLILGEAQVIDWPANVQVVFIGRAMGDRLLSISYTAADVFVLASHAETFGLVVQEAMACARPVVACAVGGVSELVVDGETGWLASTPTRDDLTRALHRAFAARTSWERIGGNGRRRAESNFSVQLQRVRYEALFQGLRRSEMPSQAALDAMMPFQG